MGLIALLVGGIVLYFLSTSGDKAKTALGSGNAIEGWLRNVAKVAPRLSGEASGSLRDIEPRRAGQHLPTTSKLRPGVAWSKVATFGGLELWQGKPGQGAAAPSGLLLLTGPAVSASIKGGAFALVGSRQALAPHWKQLEADDRWIEFRPVVVQASPPAAPIAAPAAAPAKAAPAATPSKAPAPAKPAAKLHPAALTAANLTAQPTQPSGSIDWFTPKADNATGMKDSFARIQKELLYKIHTAKNEPQKK